MLPMHKSSNMASFKLTTESVEGGQRRLSLAQLADEFAKLYDLRTQARADMRMVNKKPREDNTCLT